MQPDGHAEENPHRKNGQAAKSELDDGPDVKDANAVTDVQLIPSRLINDPALGSIGLSLENP